MPSVIEGNKRLTSLFSGESPRIRELSHLDTNLKSSLLRAACHTLNGVFLLKGETRQRTHARSEDRIDEASFETFVTARCSNPGLVKWIAVTGNRVEASKQLSRFDVTPKTYSVAN